MSNLRIIKDEEKLSLYDIKKFFNFEIKEDREGNKIYAKTTGGNVCTFKTDFTDVKMLRDFIYFIENKDIEGELVFKKECFAKLLNNEEVRYLTFHFGFSNNNVELLEKEYQNFLNNLRGKYDFIPEENELFDFNPYKKIKKSFLQKIIDFLTFS